MVIAADSIGLGSRIVVCGLGDIRRVFMLGGCVTRLILSITGYRIAYS